MSVCGENCMHVCVCVVGGGGRKVLVSVVRNVLFPSTTLNFQYEYPFKHYTHCATILPIPPMNLHNFVHDVALTPPAMQESYVNHSFS